MTIILKYLFFSILIILSFYDIKYFKLPNLLVFIIYSLGIINLLILNLNIQLLKGLAFGFILFFLFYHFFPKGIGFGDVKLAGAIGLFLGFKLTILAILLSFFSGAIVGLYLIAIGKKTMKDPIPFGPFLAFGAIFSMFFGEYIIDWYMKLLV
jgi:prepilin signal peptidase PulO-like enzyme (type II secretory pathway)